MTFREAIMTACREHGWNETQINNYFVAADKEMTEALVAINQPLKLKPGSTERDFIDGFKRFLEAVDKWSPEQSRKFIVETFEARRKKVTGN